MVFSAEGGDKAMPDRSPVEDLLEEVEQSVKDEKLRRCQSRIEGVHNVSIREALHCCGEVLRVCWQWRCAEGPGRPQLWAPQRKVYAIVGAPSFVGGDP